MERRTRGVRMDEEMGYGSKKDMGYFANYFKGQKTIGTMSEGRERGRYRAKDN
jgi:hypothetical protein